MKNKKRFLLSSLLVFFICGVAIPLFMINHKKVKADTINDLTNTTWVLNSSISWYDNNGFSNSFNLLFTSNNNSYDYLVFENVDEDFDDYYLGYQNVTPYRYDTCYYASGRYGYTTLNITDTDYQQITITGGSSATDPSFITWLQNNATQQNVGPVGTEITHKYWASYLDINMTNNEVINDDNISYKVLLNTYTDDYNDAALTGLSFSGLLTSIEDNHSYIISINNNNPITLYKGITNVIDNPMLLEFTLGDYMDDDLYDLMDDTGVWFDDARAYMAGTSFGSIYGFNRGVAYGQADGTQYSNLISSVFNGLGNMLSIQVFPNITIALLIGLPLLLGVFIIIIKILRG